MYQYTSIKKEEKNKLFDKVRTQTRISKNELTDRELSRLLDIAVEDYSEYINSWLIDNQWSVLQNLNLSESEMVHALTTKNLDFEKEFASAYSKQTGIDALGNQTELKKDYIVVSGNTQYYEVPEGREINEVLWYTPPQINSYFGGNLYGGDMSFIGGAYGWTIGGHNALGMLPASSLMLYSQDLLQKKKLFQSELTYRVLPGPNGKKVLHLMPTPGSDDEITAREMGERHAGARIWYFYYDTNIWGRDKCLEENNDIIKLPDDVPVETLKWDDLNSMSKTRIRQLFSAEVKRTAGFERGEFSGEIPTPKGNSINLDYNMYLDQAEKERNGVFDKLNQFLERLRYVNIMSEKADIADYTNRIMQYSPSKKQYFVR